MELGVEAARWMIGKALGPVSSGVLEAWAASTELGDNIEALRMELLYAEGMLNNARGHHGHSPGIKNPALSKLLHKLRDLAYRADDALDEVDYFRIQDELEGTYHAAEEHEGGCLRNHALNARHAARPIAKMLGFSKCSPCFAKATHDEPHEDTTRTRVPPCGGHWPCTGVKTSDDDEEEEDPRKGGVCWPCPCGTDQLFNNSCMGRITSAACSTIRTVGKHLPLSCYSSVSSAKSATNSNATSTGRRFLCCAQTNKAPQRERVLQTPELKFDRVEMSRKMKDIIEQLKPLCAKVSTILNLELLAANLNNNNGQYMATGRPITTSESIEPEFYGRKDVTSTLIHEITEGKYRHIDDLAVLPIVGPGGIGKTTFTQHIYKKLHDHFEVKLWVCVSVNFSVSRLLQDIADKIKKEGNASPENRIEEGLKSKRFLLVLDDMWSCSNEDEWNRFLVPFKKAQTKGSVILVTTRFPALAQMVKTTDHWIDLKGIDEKAFKELFFAYVFGNKQPPEGHSELLGIGDEIIKKLKGSPLAAKTVGRLLRNHLDLVHWTRVLESREWESQSGDHDIMPALKLSFDYLPFHLQQCFAYCSLFPEDYKFSEEEVIHFWIGLDVLHSRGENKRIEDIGLSYLVELINHGFFKKEDDDDDNGRTYYVIHDLMHELGLKVSADECLSLYSSNVRSIQILPSIRHLSINIDDSSVNDRKAFDTCKEDFSILGERLRVENLHSLMLFGKHQGSFAKTFHGLFSKAKALRVILISGDFYSMEDLLHNFSELIHLRYLRVHDNWLYHENFEMVASNNISRFYHMRVLDLRGCQDCHNLRCMSNLVKLRHFHGGVHSEISEVGKLKSLQELNRFEVGKESQGFELSQIGHLLELCGSLSIDNLENVEGREGADEAKLMHKKNLNELILNWNAKRSNKDPAREEQVLEGLKPHVNLKKLGITGHGGGACPSWLGLNLSVQNLESLCLDGVDWETFPPIGGELQLVNMGDEKKLSNSPGQHFMNLKRIELADLKRLERWVAIVGSSGQFLSHLEVLMIKHCPELVELAFSDSQQDRKAWPPNLRELVIQDCPKMLSLPPVPWRSTPCSVVISRVGLGFGLRYGKLILRSTSLVLEITGRVALHSSVPFWRCLDFDNLREVKEFWMNFESARHAGYQFAAESMKISSPRAPSGKELTQVLSYMPKLSVLRIRGCDKITGLGVVEQEEATTSSSNRSKEEEEIEAAEEGLLLLPPQLHGLSIASCPELRRLCLQTMCSLRTLWISNCLASSSSSFPFPSSLQYLYLDGVETLPPLSNLSSLATLFISNCGGDVRGLSSGLQVPTHGCFQELIVLRTTNFFSICPDSILSSLSSLETDDVAGALAAPICRLLSSSVTELSLGSHEMERFTDEQDEALQLLTSLQHLEFSCFEKLQSLPAGLHRLTSLKTLEIDSCPSIRLRLLPKDALPNSLQNLTIKSCSAIHSLPKDSLPNSLQNLTIESCSAIHSLPKDSLPNSLQNLTISDCSAIRSLPEDGLPNSLQELHIYCPSIQALPNAGLPTSLKLIDVSNHRNSKELKRQCRNLIGSIPIVRV